MPEPSGGERTLPASSRRIERAREEGNVAKSTDLSAAVSLLVALGALHAFGPEVFRSLFNAMEHYFSQACQIDVRPETLQPLMIEVGVYTAHATLPILGILVAAGVALGLVQVGFVYAPKALAPKFDRVNPFTGWQKFFSVRSLIELAKSVLKLVLAIYVAYLVLAARWRELIDYMYLTPLDMMRATSDLAGSIWFWVALAMFVLAVLDFMYQRWQWSQDLRMTVQEAKEEMKEMEGDPRLRQRIRSIQRQMAMQRMMKNVPTADVIITNPTTYAVALRYEAGGMDAPVVIAKGARLIADKIRAIAVENDVPIVQRRELARTLYRTVSVGQPIPETLFRAVAEVLAFVYRIDRRAEKAREREQRMSRLQPVA